ncbi:hypothetical protein FB446DRAFT_795556 [Lentinula raphanica]|nr:hypothetical protein FB446DRAFT_795556 [Lentinula raphanica]
MTLFRLHLHATHKPQPKYQKIRTSSLTNTNSLRPPVPAKDRIHAWLSPYSIEQKSNILKSTPAHILRDAELLVGSGLSNSTKSTYAAGILRWQQFCDSENIPEDLRMPASDILLAGFVGRHAGKHPGSTIRTWISGIRSWHILNHAPWPEDSNWLKLARRAANVKGSHLKRLPRPPITLNHLVALRNNLDLDTSFHCAIWAIALACFWGCRRLGELTIPSSSSFDPKLHVSRTGSISDYISFNERRRLKFHIPWTKTTRELGADVVASRFFEALCPCDAFQLHWSMNSRVPDGYSLFAYIDDSGCPQHMTKSRFLATVSKIWSDERMDKVYGHSFRIGGAVELLLAGVPPHVVAAIGGWTSLAFLVYWRKLEDIVVSQATDAYQNDLDRVKKVMEKFRTDTGISKDLISDCMNGNNLSLDN